MENRETNQTILDPESAEYQLYKKKYQLLLNKCELLQQDNERLVYRIQRIRKMLKRTRREKKFLIERLDKHGDQWRDAPMGVLEENNIYSPVKLEFNNVKVEPTREEKPKKAPKRNRIKADKNAPKRPPNPFFQFCQEQRPRVMEKLAGQPEPSKQELTKQLAKTWKSLSFEDKKIYYDMYERSKEKYVAEMQIYNKKTEEGSNQIPFTN